MLEQVRNLYRYREMLRNMVLRDLRGRYKGSVLGFLWTFVNPLLMLVIYSLVFSYILKTQIENYPMFIFVALLPWNYFVNSIQQGTVSLVQNAGLIKKIYLPREVFPVAAVITNLVNYLLSMIILVVAFLIAGIEIQLPVISFPIIVLIETLFAFSLTLLLSGMNVYFRDTEHLIGVLIMALFYLTPVLYPLSLIPESMRWIFELNPITPIIISYREIIFEGIWPDWESLVKVGCSGILLLAISMKVFDRLQKDAAEHI